MRKAAVHLNRCPALPVSLGRGPAVPERNAVLTRSRGREWVLQRHGMPRSVGQRDDHVERGSVHGLRPKRYGAFGCGVGCTGWTTEGPALVVSG